MHLLDHQFGQVRQHVLQIFGFAAYPGGHVLQNRLLAEIKADHVGHIGINRFVVGHPRAHGVAKGDIARCVGFHQARAAQRGASAKDTWIEIVVVHAPVDHVHPLQAARGAHVDEAILDAQVLAFHQFDAHLLGQKGMFEIRAVVHARREHHYAGVGAACGCALAQGFQQQIRVMRHRRDGVQAEQVRKQPHHHLAVLQHVGDAGGHAQVVFQHVKNAFPLCIGGADDIDSGNVRIDAAWQLHAGHLRAVLGIFQHQIGRHNAGAQDVLGVVHVVQKTVECGNALHQTPLHARPFLRRNDARHQVKGNQALVAGSTAVFGAIHREGDADAAKNHLRFQPPRLHGRVALASQPFGIAFVVRPHVAAAKRKHCVHLIELRHSQALLNTG